VAGPTHLRLKTGKKVTVARHEGGILVVKNMRGRVIGSYGPEDMGKFYKRYKSLLAGKRR